MYYFEGMEDIDRFADEVYRELIEGDDADAEEDDFCDAPRDVKWMGRKIEVLLRSKKFRSHLLDVVQSDDADAEPVKALLETGDLEAVATLIPALLLALGDFSGEYREEQEGNEAA